MKNMKKNAAALLAAVLAASCLAACGKSGDTPKPSKPDASAPDPAGTDPAPDGANDTSAQNAGDELPNWKGVAKNAYIDIGEYTVGDEKKSGEIDISIQYPSMKPASYGFAYQWDPSYVLVSGCGEVEKEIEASWKGGELVTMTFDATLEKLEDAFEVNRESLTSQIGYDRGSLAYDNFDFKVERQELMTVNGYAVCKYSGTHTYTHEHTEPNERGGLDRIFEDRASAFVTYAVDVDQLDGFISPYMITIIDDSIENPSLDPLPEGTIDRYGIKMIESIKINQH